MNDIIDNAQESFQKAMVAQGLDKLKIRDDQGNVVTGLNLKAMALPDMWLGRLMIRADNVAQFLFKQRIFEVGYIKDANTLTGIKPTSLPEDNIEEYNYNDKIMVNEGFKELIINYTINHSISNKNGFAVLNDYLDLSPENDSKYVSLMDENTITVALLNDFTSTAFPVLKRVLDHTPSNKFEI